MACPNLIAVGIEPLCDNNSGGAKQILVTDFCNIVQAGLTETLPGIYDAIQVATGEKFYVVETQRLTTFLTENLTNNFDVGSAEFIQELTIVIAKRDVERRNAIRGIGAGQKRLAIAIEDSNGIWWGVGFKEGVQLSTNTSGTGTKKADLNGYTVLFSGEASDYMSTIDPALIAALLIAAP